MDGWRGSRWKRERGNSDVGEFGGDVRKCAPYRSAYSGLLRGADVAIFTMTSVPIPDHDDYASTVDNKRRSSGTVDEDMHGRMHRVRRGGEHDWYSDSCAVCHVDVQSWASRMTRLRFQAEALLVAWRPSTIDRQDSSSVPSLVGTCSTYRRSTPMRPGVSCLLIQESLVICALVRLR